MEIFDAGLANKNAGSHHKFISQLNLGKNKSPIKRLGYIYF